LLNERKGGIKKGAGMNPDLVEQYNHLISHKVEKVKRALVQLSLHDQPINLERVIDFLQDKPAETGRPSDFIAWGKRPY
jgi:hypothetical protein